MLVPKSDTKASMPSTAVSMVGRLMLDPSTRAWSDEYGRFYLRYWGASYGYYRRTGTERERARDLVQDFFSAGLDGRHFQGFDRARAPFSKFFRMRLVRWRIQDWRKWRKERERKTVSLSEREEEFIDKEVRGIEDCLADPQAPSPAKELDRRWAQGVIRAGFEALAKKLTARRADIDLQVFREWFCKAPGDRPERGALGQSLGLGEKTLIKRMERLEERIKEEVEEQLRTYLRPGVTMKDLIDDLFHALQPPRRARFRRTAEDDASDTMRGGGGLQ